MIESSEGKPLAVSISGGTGRYPALKGSKYFLSITAVFNNTDSGGSSGRLRDELGYPPPGDGAQALAALAKNPDCEVFLRQRFKAGVGLNGHKVANLMASAALDCFSGNVARAWRFLSDMYCVEGSFVCPVSAENQIHQAVATEKGTVIIGEHLIDTTVKDSPIIDSWLTQKKPGEVKIDPVNLTEFKEETKAHVRALPEVLNAIKNAELIFIGPGSHFTSVISNLCVDGLAEEIRRSSAVKIYVCNFANDSTETVGFSAEDHAQTLYHFLGGDDSDFMLDYFILNGGFILKKPDGSLDVIGEEELDKKLLEAYRREGKDFVKIGDRSRLLNYARQVMCKPMVTVVGTGSEKFLRHHPLATANAIMSTYFDAKSYINVSQATGEVL